MSTHGFELFKTAFRITRRKIFIIYKVINKKLFQ